MNRFLIASVAVFAFVAVVLVTFLSVPTSILWPTAQAVLGAFLGFWLVLFLLPLIPKAIELLANNPNRHQPGDYGPNMECEYPISEFGFFTELLPGRVKNIERGGTFIRCVMSYEDHAFEGEVENSSLKRNDDRYWEVIPTTDRDDVSESHPIPKPSISKMLFVLPLLWWAWKRWVYMVTGFVFTGIYPFQKVRVYKIERYEKTKMADGSERIERIVDYSDHVRVADFQFPIRIPSADTKDKIPVKVFTELMFRVFNPYLAAYQTDDWSARTSAAAVDAVTHFTRLRPLDDVLSAAEDEEQTRALSNELMRIGDRTLDTQTSPNTITQYGLQTIQALIIDISLRDKEDEDKFGDLAVARVDSAAEAERAKGRAENLREQMKAIREDLPVGIAVLAAERNVRTAEAAGDKAIVIMGSGGDTDPLQAAILAELKKQNQGEGETT